MKVERIIDWLGRMTAGHLPRETRTERLLCTDRVIEVARMLQKDEFELVRLHDVEGHSIEALQIATGLPDDTIRQNVQVIRERLCRELESSNEPAPEPAEFVL